MSENIHLSNNKFFNFYLRIFCCVWHMTWWKIGMMPQYLEQYLLIKEKWFYGDDNNDCLNIILLSHNGNRFCLPFLLSATDHHMVPNDGINISYQLDTLFFSENSVYENSLAIPNTETKGTLYYHFTNKDQCDIAHHVLVNVKATMSILKHLPFLNHHKYIVEILMLIWLHES